jgi:hypothetical protein
MNPSIPTLPHAHRGALQALPRRRSELLLPLYRRLAADMGIRPLAAQGVEGETAETLAPHPRLRQQLQDDPAMAALLPGASGRFALGAEDDLPFSVLPSGLILLPPALTDDAAALAAAARWGLEAAHEVEQGPPDAARLVRLLRHGAGLLDALAPAARDLLLQLLPPAIGAELWGGRAGAPSDGLLAWMAARVGGTLRAEVAGTGPDAAAAGDAGGLELPVESLLVAGGDSRLHLDAHSGQNRYGVPPRPRPEAVHFSSSTASAVSDYGFLFCDLLRRDLLTAQHADGIPVAELRRRAADATGRAITRLLGLADADCEAAIAASGTDTELLAVLVARAGADGRPVLNLLVSPEESGRGVRLAGSGRWFDDLAATGARIAAGSAVFADGPVAVEEVAIRDATGRPRPLAEVDADFIAAGRAALDRGCHVLAHVLLASKTGLSAPSRAAVDTLVALAPQRVDVVVDACQMRTPFADLGQVVRAGWMLQVSGSKFLTGPPFSGALVLPAALRSRAAAVGAGLRAAPGIGHPHDWTHDWVQAGAAAMPVPPGAPPSFGSVFRWLPALLEAALFASLPEDFRAAAFDRFRAALAPRLAASPWLQPIDTGDDGPAGDDAEALERLSILSFQVLGRRWDGSLAPLGDADCRRLFEALNRDMSAFLPGAGPAAAALARLQAHIGQPVTLGGPPGAVTVLRMVLGARFFSIVGYAGAGAAEAALQSEIADARRAIAKVELLAEHWWRLARALENP